MKAFQFPSACYSRCALWRCNAVINRSVFQLLKLWWHIWRQAQWPQIHGTTPSASYVIKLSSVQVLSQCFWIFFTISIGVLFWSVNLISYHLLISQVNFGLDNTERCYHTCSYVRNNWILYSKSIGFIQVHTQNTFGEIYRVCKVYRNSIYFSLPFYKNNKTGLLQ